MLKHVSRSGANMSAVRSRVSGSLGRLGQSCLLLEERKEYPDELIGARTCSQMECLRTYARRCMQTALCVRFLCAFSKIRWPTQFIPHSLLRALMIHVVDRRDSPQTSQAAVLPRSAPGDPPQKVPRGNSNGTPSRIAARSRGRTCKRRRSCAHAPGFAPVNISGVTVGIDRSSRLRPRHWKRYGSRISGRACV